MWHLAPDPLRDEADERAADDAADAEYRDDEAPHRRHLVVALLPGHLLVGGGVVELVAVPDPLGDEPLRRVEDAGVVAVLEAAAEGDGEDGVGEVRVQALQGSGRHDVSSFLPEIFSCS